MSLRSGQNMSLKGRTDVALLCDGGFIWKHDVVPWTAHGEKSIRVKPPLESGWVAYGQENGYNFPCPRLLRVNPRSAGGSYMVQKWLKLPLSPSFKGKMKKNKQYSERNSSTSDFKSLGAFFFLFFKVGSCY